VRTLAVAVLALVLTGCGGARDHGTATLWVTRDRGAHVLFSGTVPAGLTALQALDRRTDVKTRYGGRFVQSIDGVAGDAGKQRDWFYFVNGIEADRGAADYRLHDGDVEWWDMRSWKGRALSVPVVVGAFPEPFLHGYGGKRGGVSVGLVGGGLGETAPRLVALRDRMATLLRTSGKPKDVKYVFMISPTHEPFHARRDPGGRILFVANGRDTARLLRDPTLARHRYQGLRP